MLTLREIPKVDFEQLRVATQDLSYFDQIKLMFFPRSNPDHILSFRSRSIYEDIIINDAENILGLGIKYEETFAVYQSKPDRQNLTNYTVYKILGLIPYGILNDGKLCSVDYFEIDVDKCWKTY